MAGKKKVTRLEDLEVHEVSSVDRPANKRPFLMVKNEDGTETPAPATPAAPDAPVVADETVPIETLAQLLKALGEQLVKLEASDPIAKRLSVSESVRRSTFKAAGEAMRRIDTAMSTMSMADVDENGSPEFMALIASELSDISKLIATTAKAFKSRTKKSEDDLSEIEKSIDDITEGLRTEVEKAGAKMARKRLSSFRTALKTLKSLLDEIDPPVEKADATDPHVEKLTKALDESIGESKKLADVVKRQAAELKKHRDSRQGSNVVPVEGGDGNAQDDDAWPFDMNHESRGSVDKSVDFG